MRTMASWKEVHEAVPDLAAGVQSLLDAHKHKTIATLRRDGSPLISGTDATVRDGELWLGMMPDSRKALDLLRDPRLALHSATVDPDMADGDAKIAGRAIELDDPAAKQGHMDGMEEDPGPFHLFRVDVTEISRVTLGGDPPDHLVIESWHDGTGYQRVERQ
jgi:hypothetical protein